jgi:hypothetical protein
MAGDDTQHEDFHAWVEKEFIAQAAWGLLPEGGAESIRARICESLNAQLAAREQSLESTGEALETIDAARAAIEHYWGVDSPEKIRPGRH